MIFSLHAYQAAPRCSSIGLVLAAYRLRSGRRQQGQRKKEKRKKKNEKRGNAKQRRPTTPVKRTRQLVGPVPSRLGDAGTLRLVLIKGRERGTEGTRQVISQRVCPLLQCAVGATTHNCRSEIVKQQPSPCHVGCGVFRGVRMRPNEEENEKHTRKQKEGKTPPQAVHSHRCPLRSTELQALSNTAVCHFSDELKRSWLKPCSAERNK